MMGQFSMPIDILSGRPGRPGHPGRSFLDLSHYISFSFRADLVPLEEQDNSDPAKRLRYLPEHGGIGNVMGAFETFRPTVRDW